MKSMTRKHKFSVDHYTDHLKISLVIILLGISLVCDDIIPNWPITLQDGDGVMRKQRDLHWLYICRRLSCITAWDCQTVRITSKSKDWPEADSTWCHVHITWCSRVQNVLLLKLWRNIFDGLVIAKCESKRAFLLRCLRCHNTSKG